MPDLILSRAASLHEAIAPAADPAEMAAEVATLKAGGALVTSGHYAVYLSGARAIPALMHELGRQREMAFRAVGEGTGRAVDLDRFDGHYRHLLLWDHAGGQLAGAYRLALTGPTLVDHGPQGLYTSTLFQFSPEFIEALTPGLELGRSFLAAAYQRSAVPLALLWRGIGQFLRQHPECVRLFGAVSISGGYSELSRQLIVEFLQQRQAGLAAPGLAEVVPRHPWPQAGADRPEGWGAISPLLIGLNQVSARISLLEGGSRGMPELLKHYLRLNAQLLAFNVDPDFSNCLDALLLVDLREVPASFRKRFLGM